VVHMVLAMTRPRKHPRTGVYEFRKRVPDRLRPLVGKREVKRSLKTKDPAVARERHAAVAAEVEAQWNLLGSGGSPLDGDVTLTGLGRSDASAVTCWAHCAMQAADFHATIASRR
jgi:hypothetical protein